MKTLKPILRKRYKCDFCKNKIYFNKSACEAHEYKCYKNPNRHCLNCDDTGTETFATLGANLGVIPDGDSRDCVACIIAKKAGGKSYLEADLSAE